MQDYIKKAVLTESKDFVRIAEVLSDPKIIRLFHSSMGVVTEAGELIDALKKQIFYNKILDEINLIEEMGDLFWYLAIMADTLGVTFEDIMQRNIAKLKARYDGNFSNKKAIKRNLKREIQVLKQSKITKTNSKKITENKFPRIKLSK